jgi:hypothetical protein
MLHAGFIALMLLWPSGALADPVLATVLGDRLVSDIPGNARALDPNLVNPIGIALSSGSPDWGGEDRSRVVPPSTTRSASRNRSW